MDAAQMSLWRRLNYTRLRDAVRGRLDASLDQQKIVADAGLPAAVADMILLVVRRTKLWRSEQVDVAKELVAHFQDGLAAGQTPQQLVASFGDPAAAAQLIRRAKKRGRPLIWYLWHYGWLTVAALVGIYMVAGLYLVMGRPSIKTDYLAIINQQAASVPEDKRAWPLYRRALLELGMTSYSVYSKPGGTPANTVCDARPGDEKWPEAAQFLNDHASSIAKLREAAGRHDLGLPAWTTPQACPVEDREILVGDPMIKFESDGPEPIKLEDRWLISTWLPQVQLMRPAARLLASDCDRAAVAGDGATATADIVALLGISRHAEEIPFLVCTVVSAAVQGMADGSIQEILTTHPDVLTNDQLRDVAHALATNQTDWQRGVEGDRANFLDVVQRLYSDQGNGDGRITAEGLRRIAKFAPPQGIDNITGLRKWRMQFGDLALGVVAPTSVFILASRREVVDKYDQLIDEQKAKLDIPLWKLSEADLKSPAANWSAKDRLRYLPVSLMLPANLREVIETHNGRRDGVLIGIALELYRRSKGHWPTSLDELSPRWLPAVPIDRISGKPLGYRIVDDRPVVYSVGVDRDNDGGRAPSSTDDQLNADLASPQHFRLEPVTGSEQDGDWVIWSTVESK